MAINYNRPLFFKSNRVRRIYKGGKRFAEFFGDGSTEGFFPEEWVCSTVRALNAGSTDLYEGISVLESGEYFSRVLEEYSEELLGNKRKKLGVLVKVLDSSIRLPVQVHPDRAFSKKWFNSCYGKTEAWVILDADEDAVVYFGFNREYSLEEFKSAFEESEEKLLSMLNRIPVKKGDVLLVPGKSVHAIGAGCLLLEIQEPTDFTIQPEDKCGDYVLCDDDKYLGLKRDDAFECFDMSLYGMDKSLKYTKCEPLEENGIEKILTYERTRCFEANRYFITKGQEVTLSAPSIYVATEGSGTLKCDGLCREIKKGDYFFAGIKTDGKIKISGDGIQLIECCIPQPNEN